MEELTLSTCIVAAWGVLSVHSEHFLWSPSLVSSTHFSSNLRVCVEPDTGGYTLSGLRNSQFPVSPFEQRVWAEAVRGPLVSAVF